MEWTADVSAGDWLRERIDDPWRGTMHDVVPRGFPAYARIFHPAHRERPVGRAWPADGDAPAWERFLADRPEVDAERVTWAQTAAVFGTTMHSLAQWGRLIGRGEPYGDGAQLRDVGGWRYDEPQEGRLDPESLAAVAEILAAHTATPDDGFIALWDGWGGVTGGMGYGASRMLFAAAGAEEEGAHHADFLAHTARDVFNDVFRPPTWQPGILSDEISRGPRLELPARGHVLFRGGVRELADAGWPRCAPWRDHERERHGFPPTAESPSLVWPDDRAWTLVTEVDFDSTIVGGEPELVRALVADPRIEARPIREGADLSWDGDDVNR